jgi:hypothetical protein
MTAKRLRMTLDFEVEVEELTDERLREYYRRFTNYEELAGDPETWENISRQRRLQRALLEDEEALRRFLTYAVVDEVDSRLDSRLGGAFRVRGAQIEEAILEPVFARLGEADARYFKELTEAGTLWEGVEAMSRCFVVRWRAAVLEDVRVIAEGMVDDDVG